MSGSMSGEKRRDLCRYTRSVNLDGGPGPLAGPVSVAGDRYGPSMWCSLTMSFAFPLRPRPLPPKCPLERRSRQVGGAPSDGRVRQPDPMINRSQFLVLGFFVGVWIALVAILTFAPEIYVQMLNPPHSARTAVEIDS